MIFNSPPAGGNGAGGGIEGGGGESRQYMIASAKSESGARAYCVGIGLAAICGRQQAGRVSGRMRYKRRGSRSDCNRISPLTKALFSRGAILKRWAAAHDGRLSFASVKSCLKLGQLLRLFAVVRRRSRLAKETLFCMRRLERDVDALATGKIVSRLVDKLVEDNLATEHDLIQEVRAVGAEETEPRVSSEREFVLDLGAIGPRERREILVLALQRFEEDERSARVTEEW